MRKTRKSSLLGKNIESAKRATPASRKGRLGLAVCILGQTSLLFNHSHRIQRPNTPQWNTPWRCRPSGDSHSGSFVHSSPKDTIEIARQAVSQIISLFSKGALIILNML